MDRHTLLTVRERLSLTQTQLAEALGIGRRTLGQYEKGYRPIPKTIALACSSVAFGIAEMDEITVLSMRTRDQNQAVAREFEKRRKAADRRASDLFWECPLDDDVKRKLANNGVSTITALRYMGETRLKCFGFSNKRSKVIMETIRDYSPIW